MYGVDPFDQGLDQLAEAALIDDAEAAGAASPAIPHAYAVPVGLNEGGAAAAPTGAQAGQGGGAAPEEVSTKQLMHRAAARTIVPGCQHWDVKNRGSWPAGATIPNADAMKWEVTQRDPERRPSAWDAAKLCRWLHEYAVPAYVAPVPPVPTPTTTPADAEGDGGGGGNGTESGGQRQRWVAKCDSPRLAHVLVELKSEFLSRDTKPTRVQLDSSPRNAFWQKAALKFNDANFKPSKHKSTDMLIQMDFDSLDPSHDPTFTVDAATLNKHFNEARKYLKECMQNFRTSGMGDCPTEDREKQSNTVFSSTFASYCQGKPAVLYLYHVLMPHDLLTSFQADMPEDSTHSSEGGQREVSGPRPSVKGGGAAAKMRMLTHALEQPVMIAQTADQKKSDYFGAQLAESRAKLQEEQLSALKEEQLEATEEKIEKAGGEAKAANYLVLKRDRLQAELEAMEEKKSKAAAEAPTHFTDDVAGSSTAGAQHQRPKKRSIGGRGGARGGAARESDEDEDVDDEEDEEGEEDEEEEL